MRWLVTGEGGFTASIIAASDPKIAAIAFLAGGAMANFEDLLSEQVLYDLELQRQVDPSEQSGAGHRPNAAPPDRRGEGRIT